jgi:ubiquitin C-terminal hydrolase
MDRFTQPENIAVKDWTCQKCGKVSQEANKRLSIKRLPPVLSIQFKVSSSFPYNTKRSELNDDSDGSASNNVEQKHIRSTLPCVFLYQ